MVCHCLLLPGQLPASCNLVGVLERCRARRGDEATFITGQHEFELLRTETAPRHDAQGLLSRPPVPDPTFRLGLLRSGFLTWISKSSHDVAKGWWAPASCSVEPRGRGKLLDTESHQASNTLLPHCLWILTPECFCQVLVTSHCSRHHPSSPPFLVHAR